MTTKALIITANYGVEQSEFIKPFEYLQSKGIEVIHAAEKNDEVVSVKADKEPSTTYKPHTTFDSVSYEDYDILIVPGGTVNADILRINPDVQKIIQYFTDHKKVIAAICHAPWVLIDAERIKDKNLTSFKSIRLDLENAGGKWVDQEVHRCNTDGWVLITSRCPDDIPAFNQAIVDELDPANAT